MKDSFGEILKAFRKRKHLTQRDLATRLGTHYNTVSAWERGDYRPSSKTIILELAHQLDLNKQERRQLLEACSTLLAPFWLVPHPRNPLFTGRDATLHMLNQPLQAGNITSCPQVYELYGPVGIGKTQLAVEYAYRHRLLYQAVFWISAHSQTSVIASLQQIAEHLGLPGRQEGSEQEVVNSVQKWLSQRSQWLLIWDHVEQLELLLNFLPLAYRGMILLTTRHSSLIRSSWSIQLDPMTVEEGLWLLLRRAKVFSHLLIGGEPRQQMFDLAWNAPKEYAAAQELVELVEAFPLRLDWLGAYIEETGCSVVGCLHRYRTQSRQLFSR